jgi:hypothetical protein
MTRAIALRALAALGLSRAPFHETFHADGRQTAAGAPELDDMIEEQDTVWAYCAAEFGLIWIKRRRCAAPGPALPAPGSGLGEALPGTPAPSQPSRLPQIK